MKWPLNIRSGLAHVVAWSLAALAILVLVGVTARMVDHEWSEESQAARRELGNMSRLSQEHALRTLQAADQALQLARALYLRDGLALDLSHWVGQGAIDAALFHQVGIIDAQGIYRLSNLAQTPQVDLSDREHFKVHLQQNDDQLFVSKPVLGRVSNKWTIQLTRRITRPDGSFGGVAVVSMDADYFTHFYASLDVGANGIAALIGTDGVVRARRSKLMTGAGANLRDVPPLRAMAQGAVEGFFENRSPIDQALRLYHFRKIAGYPLFVAVGFGQDDFQASVRQTQRTQWTQAALGTLLILGLATLFSWHWQREQRQTRALRHSQAYTQLALDSGGLGVWEWDLRHHRFTLDERLQALLGFTPGELPNDNDSFMQRLHPDDQHQLRLLLLPVLKGEVPRLLFEHRLRHKDGHWIWLMARGQVVARDAQGRALRLMGTDVDRTERRQADEAQRVAAVAFESSSAMMISDAQLVILRVNPAFAELSGYTQAEVVGQPSSLLKSGRESPAFYQAMWTSLNHTGHWEGEIWNRRKDGAVFPDWLSITAVKDERGQVTHYVSVHADITLRKRSEEEIRKLAFFDPLTGLPNRRLLLDRLQQMRAALARQGEVGAVLFMDLDRFKLLNDTHGHQRGDELLTQVAQRLQTCVREVDTVARLGGDEFVVALAQLGTAAAPACTAAVRVGEKIREALNQPFDLSGLSWQLSASIGVALLQDASQPVEDVLKDADTAMYIAKNAGRNQVQVFQATHRA
ncbi:diguanylate cyclase [Rhodoferax sp.]|uniref:bifunctional diguanylate cyclase/phosphodiesterase n=1 Tax=Rhodoferax sp. TaxID=50421 RepID=UPI0026030796|nr:diguanylate cyclase [Rhodoferax sp.]MDD2925756.1 diguanylate cyclase [Rhodoferax sp.]